MKKYIELIKMAQKGKYIPYWTCDLFLLLDEVKLLCFLGCLWVAILGYCVAGLLGAMKGCAWVLTVYLAAYGLSFAVAVFGMAWEDMVRVRKGRKNVTLGEILRKEIDFEKECS